MTQTLPIGIDQFRKLREENIYYVDKTLFIQDFLQTNDEVALITRPRRFGKTLNMTMLREFLDITVDSTDIFSGLAIMSTPCAAQINSRPVIYFTFKDCTGTTSASLKTRMTNELIKEYSKYKTILDHSPDMDWNEIYASRYLRNLQKMADDTITFNEMTTVIEDIIHIVYQFYHIKPVLLIDEYDQPIVSSYEYGYKEELGEFFAAFLGSALKGNPDLSQALLTGIQRVAKESIFSRLNNIWVYTVTDKTYAPYFGLTEHETKNVLEDYGMELTEAVKLQYDGYRFGGLDIYNPWSIFSFVKNGELRNYWINTSTNYLIKEALSHADHFFMEDFERLIQEDRIEIGANLETSFIELQDNYSLWGLLINSGYITVEERIHDPLMTVRIPNAEVCSEFRKIVASQVHIADQDLQLMFRYLMNQDFEQFMRIYSKIVISCTSYFDAKENAYHMLFLGMCITLKGLYHITSNIENGLGRSDITLRSLSDSHMHIIIEFKQGKDIDALKYQALDQIKDNQYFSGLHGSTMCIGIAHDGKRCDGVYEILKL